MSDNNNKMQGKRMFFLYDISENNSKMTELVNKFSYLPQGQRIIYKDRHSWDSLLCILCLGQTHP